MLTTYLTAAAGTSDITQLVAATKWSGDKSSICRKLDLNVLLLPSSGLPVPALGDVVTMADEQGVLFTGYIVQRTLNSESSVLSCTCYDRGIYLRNNDGTYKFRSTTAEAMVRQVCQDNGIPVLELAVTGVPLDRKFSAVSIDKIIATAYSLASEQTGERYCIRMMPEGLQVKLKEQSRTSLNLRPRSNLIQASTTESIINMVNSVAIQDEQGNVLQVLSDGAARDLYGQMQRRITQRSGEDAAAAARAMLEDGAMERSVTVDVLGDRSLITGETVVVREDATGLQGLFWIDADAHTWQRGVHTCRLTLNCRSVMTKSTAGSDLK